MVAPKLSELETNMYLMPLLSSMSNVPLPSMAGYKSPWPGGHHSWLESAGHVAGMRSSISTFGALFCTNSKSLPVPKSLYLDRASSVSEDVEKEFMSMNFKLGMLYFFFIHSTCFAMRSRKVLPPVTCNNDFALSKPIPVPKPPFNFKMTVSFKSSGFGVMFKVSKSGNVGTGSRADSGIIVLVPDVKTLKLYLKAFTAASVSLSFPPAFIFASYFGQVALNFKDRWIFSGQQNVENFARAWRAMSRASTRLTL
mmetsp:Transcript_52885/g.123770  ORF Transcript_52885/g.123770 Transcript_52885/m.123770 type:complete len:254 (-) Transcript_52885:19-780(-)